MTRTTFIAAALALAVTLPAMPVQAAAARTFLSAAGSDSNNCINVLTPCRHLATAFAATAADGEIYVLDPANYGSLNITHGVSIEGHGWASIAPPGPGQAAIVSNANPGDKINIIGVVLDGTAIGSATGILFNSGGSLIVRDSVIRNFGSAGITFSPNSSAPCHLYVSNTLVSDNNGGIGITPACTGNATGSLDRVAMQNNASDGLDISSFTGQTINVTVSDSVSEGNNNGISVFYTGGAASVMVRNSTIANNTNNGLLMTSTVGGCSGGLGAIIRVSRSAITGNGTGWVNATCSAVVSYGDNNIDGNTNVNTEPPSPLTYH